VEQRHDSNVLVLELTGRIGAASARFLADAFARAFARGDRLVVDFSGVDYLSSAGLSALEGAAGRGDGNGRGHGTLVLCGVPEAVRVALDLGGLLPRLEVEASREAAIARAREL
jgi:anti-anti-sigma factor